jgi:hypothetical protein
MSVQGGFAWLDQRKGYSLRRETRAIMGKYIFLPEPHFTRKYQQTSRILAVSYRNRWLGRAEGHKRF